LSDISRESSFQRLVVPGSLTPESGTPPAFEPVSHNISVLKLAYTGLDADPIMPGFEIVRRSINDSDAYTPAATGASGLPLMHFIHETGELVMHRDTAESFPREGVSVTYQKSGFRQGDINPMVYFTGREILTTDTSHIPTGTQLIYNVTQYFSRAAGTPVGGTPPTHFNFTLEFPPYNPTGGIPDGLSPTLPIGAVMAGNVVSIPAHLFNTQSNISVTYAVENPVGPGGAHIMTDTRVQGVELVRALGIDGIAIPLDQMELNRSFDMHNQYIEYEFAPRTRIAVNSLAKNVLTDKMFADFRRFFAFADALHISSQSDLEQHFRQIYDDEASVQKYVQEQLASEGAMARDALFQQFNNMLFLIDKHVDNSTREQTLLGARMVRMELVQNRLEEDEVSYTKLTSDNEDTDLIRATIQRFSAEAIFMASLRANSGVIQMSLANFLR
jgi:flagellin-like hook-associated protein FlgL